MAEEVVKKGPTFILDASASASLGGAIRSAAFSPWSFIMSFSFTCFFSERREKKGQANQEADNCSVLTVCQVKEAQF